MVDNCAIILEKQSRSEEGLAVSALGSAILFILFFFVVLPLTWFFG